MTQITRYNGNIKPFADDALGTERTIFGAETQDDTLDANINTDFFRGWGIVGVNGLPTKQDFNAFAYTSTALTAYLYQMGVAEWNASQEYFTGAIANVAGILFKAVQDNTGENPTTDDGSNWLQVTENSEFSLPLNFISGLDTALDADNEHDILIKVGACRDDANGADIILETQITKRIDADWAVGDNEGGFPSSLTLAPNTWYHVFVMTDGTTVDAGFDSDIDAVNLLADSTYTSYRRVGSVLTDGSSNIVPYYQYGDVFNFKSPELVVDLGSLPTTRTEYTVSSPLGVVCECKIRMILNSAGSVAVRLYSPFDDDFAVSTGISGVSVPNALDVGAGDVPVSETYVFSNDSSEVSFRASSTSVNDFRMELLSYIDTRGK